MGRSTASEITAEARLADPRILLMATRAAELAFLSCPLIEKCC